MNWQKQMKAQYLSPENINKRLDFAKKMLAKVDNGQIDLLNVAWTDESWLRNIDDINRRNNGRWRIRGEHLIDRPNPIAQRRQHHTKVMMFCLIHLEAAVIGPEFLDDYSDVSESAGLDQQKYREIIRKTVQELKERLGSDFETCWFQQHGAPPHTARATISYLNELFSGRLIAKNAEFEWPPNSLDLNPLDYWFWGMVSSLVGERGNCDRNDLVATACLAIHAVNSDKPAIERAIRSFRVRLAACIEAHGHHFEHFYRTMKDRLIAMADNPCEDCGEVHDSCEFCMDSCTRLWFARFDFNIDDIVRDEFIEPFDAQELELNEED